MQIHYVPTVTTIPLLPKLLPSCWHFYQSLAYFVRHVRTKFNDLKRECLLESSVLLLFFPKGLWLWSCVCVSLSSPSIVLLHSFDSENLHLKMQAMVLLSHSQGIHSKLSLPEVKPGSHMTLHSNSISYSNIHHFVVGPVRDTWWWAFKKASFLVFPLSMN